ncbi:MAG: glycosyltransferase family 9 protein [Paludibacteraceae bacterium]|nr:glycosyltransferase family 9 protein [Paludibacteraceae bacterium]
MTRFLVIRLSALGDVAMVTAVLRQVALQHPENDYTLLSKKRMGALLVDCPTNVHFVAYGETIDWTLYDTVIDAHSVWRSIGIDLQALLHGKRVKKLHKPRLRRWLLTQGKHVTVASMLELYARLFSLSTLNSQLSTINSKSGIGIAPFAAHKGKTYPHSQVEKVLLSLSQKTKETVYLFGFGDEEKQICEDWERKYPNVVSLVGKHSLAEELEIMRGLRVMFTMDSGNMHLASLVGTRVVSIWGATQPKMGFLGYGQSKDDCITLNLPCSPCSAYGKKPCKFGDYRCLHIAPQDIADHLSK